MRTIIYTFIALFVFGLIAMSFTNKAETKSSIVIQAIDIKVSSVSLSQSAEIISNRLKDFSPEKFELTIVPEKNQIQLRFNNNNDLKTIENLLVKKGILAFYETFNRKSLSDILPGNHHLFSLFNEETADNLSSEIGFISFVKVAKINDYLNTLGLNQRCKFAWSQNADNSDVCLYALKIDSKKTAVVVRSDIKSVKFNQAGTSRNNEIEIQFKESAVLLWADICKRNINNALAIVLDDIVIAAPVVRSEINGGRCTITGNYTKTEARYIAALANNGELPLNFKVLKVDNSNN
ncbi:MAG: SecDF P1 head subdomain-containing protein [Bacteroidales bacterium]